MTAEKILTQPPSWIDKELNNDFAVFILFRDAIGMYLLNEHNKQSDNEDSNITLMMSQWGIAPNRYKRKLKVLETQLIKEGFELFNMLTNTNDSQLISECLEMITKEGKKLLIEYVNDDLREIIDEH